MPRKLDQVINPDVLKEAARKSSLRRQLEHLAERRFADEAERNAFLAEEAPALTDEELAALQDAELLVSLDPTR